MPEIVIADRTMARVLALLPAMVIALGVRILTLTSPPLGLRLGAAAAVALGAWTSYRLLTSRVTVRDDGVHVRGVMFEADLPWSEIDEVAVVPASRGLRLLVWGIMRPHALQLRAGKHSVLPVAAVTHADDEMLDRAVASMRVRLGAWGVPAQRQPADELVDS